MKKNPVSRLLRSFDDCILTRVHSAAKSDVSGTELHEPIISFVWWFREPPDVVTPGESILWKLDAPFVSLLIRLTCRWSSCETEVSADTMPSSSATDDLFGFFFVEVETPLTLFTPGVDDGCAGKWVGIPCGVVDLCCFSMCSSVWAAGWDNKRASKGLLSTTTTLPGVGWSPALKWPVFTWRIQSVIDYTYRREISKTQWVQPRILTEAVCKNIFSMMENRGLRLNFLRTFFYFLFFFSSRVVMRFYGHFFLKLPVKIFSHQKFTYWFLIYFTYAEWKVSFHLSQMQSMFMFLISLCKTSKVIRVYFDGKHYRTLDRNLLN